jgi:L-ascorbate metabolism protein UlaG (beta-lactamase superfamily)
MLTTLIILFAIALYIYLFTHQPKFGSYPKSKRLERIQQSPNYRNGSFQNISPTPSLAEGVSYYKVMKDFFFVKHPKKVPIDVIPSVKNDLKNIEPSKDVLVWFGHSSYYMQVDRKKFLVDPVFSGTASPLSFGTRAFKGTDIYTADDFPEIDYLFITHDHWDHLDYKTIMQLKPKIKKIICGLGVGEHFERWGFDMNIVTEKDWNEKFTLEDGFNVETVTARHFSGRGFLRNKSLWMSYAVRTPTMNIFIGGDSGYDKHFKETGARLGPFDLAVLENGQYDPSWKYIHMLPDQLLKAARELRANKLLAVHSSKFSLSNHSWNEPLSKLIENNKSENMNVITPMIGEIVFLKDSSQKFSHWWEGLK